MNCGKNVRSALLLSVLLCTSAAQAELTSLMYGRFTSSNGNGCGYSSFGYSNFPFTGPTGSALCNQPGTAGLVAARVADGQIGASASLSGSPSAGFNVADIRAEATVQSEGIIRFEGPAARSRPRLAFDLSGQLGLVRPAADQSVVELIGLSITVGAPTESAGSSDRYTRYMYSDGNPDDVFLLSGLLLGGFTGLGPYVVVTPVFELPTGIDLVLSISITVGTTIGGPGNSFAQGSSDFYNTFSFSRTGPAALFVDPGFTMNSADYRVVDNQFSAPVPEPGTWALMVFGLACTGGFVRRIRQRAV